MRERFVVGSVTGYPITEASINNPRARSKERTFWYVYDSAYCYGIVREFRGHGGTCRSPEQLARALAARLNEEEAACQ